MSSNYLGNPTSTQAPSAAPGAGVAPTVVLPADGDPDNAASVAQAFKVLADFSALAMLQAFGALGDGSDGALAFDGSTTILGMVPSSNVYTMTRDIFATSITFSGSAKLFTAGYRVYCRGAIDTTASAIVGGGIVNADGNAGGNGVGGTGGAGGAAGATGILLSGAAGGAAAATTGNGTAGSNATTSFGAAGGASNGGGSAAGGTATAPTALLGTPRLLSIPHIGMIVGNNSGSAAHTLYQGGAGGGGAGNGNITMGGGGGGAGGGVLGVAARTLKLKVAADIRAAGGAGGAAGGGGGVAANGGGGGGGGAAVIAYGSYTTQDSSVLSSAHNAPGGAGGAAANGGNAGSAGSTGNCYAIPMGAF